MIKLYGLGFSNNVNKVRYCLNQLGLDFEWVQTNPMQGENQTPEFEAISPTKKIPAIEIDGFTLFESSTINRYLAGREKSSLYPQDLKARAIVDAWTDYASIHVSSAMGRISFNRVLAPRLGVPVDENSIKAGLDFLAKYFPILDKQLSKNTYLAGKELSLADIALLAALDGCELNEIKLDPYPHLVKWRATLTAMPLYQKCYKDYTEFVMEGMKANAA